MRLGLPSDNSGYLTKNVYVFLIFSKYVKINSLIRVRGDECTPRWRNMAVL